MSAEPSETHISFKLRDTKGAETEFKVRKIAKFSKVMKAYGARIGEEVSSFRFNLDGVMITSEDTPESLNMEEDDVIDVQIAQTGGSLLRRFL